MSLLTTLLNAGNLNQFYLRLQLQHTIWMLWHSCHTAIGCMPLSHRRTQSLRDTDTHLG